MKIEKSPIRSCIVCRGRFDKFSLIKMVVNSDGQVLPDPMQSRPGRGAYVCRNFRCILHLKDKHLHAAWRKCMIAGSQSDDLLDRLQKSFGISEVNI